MKIDLEHEGIDILVDGQLVLRIGQVSDNDTINLFLYPEGFLTESVMHQENKKAKCTHELLSNREKLTSERR